MNRGIGESQFTSALPDFVVAAAGVVTQLGDMWFVVAGICLLAAAHRAGLSLSAEPRRDYLFLMAVAVGSYSLTLVLKHSFLLPRPPGAATATPPGWLPGMATPAYESMVTGDGYGFPSGHALKSTAVYGGAAATLTVRSERRRYAAAGVIIAAVALSRVFIGVHYLVDVVVGTAVGVAFLFVVLRVTDRRPGRAFGVATALGALAFGLSLSPKAALAAGVGVVGAAAWIYAERSPNAFGRTPAVLTPEFDDDR